MCQDNCETCCVDQEVPPTEVSFDISEVDNGFIIRVHGFAGRPVWQTLVALDEAEVSDLLAAELAELGFTSEEEKNVS